MIAKEKYSFVFKHTLQDALKTEAEKYYTKRYKNPEAREMAQSADELENIGTPLSPQTTGKIGEDAVLELIKIIEPSAKKSRGKIKEAKKKIDIIVNKLQLEVKTTTKINGTIDQLRCHSDDIYYIILNIFTKELYFDTSTNLFYNHISKQQHGPETRMTSWPSIKKEFPNNIYSFDDIYKVVEEIEKYEKTH